MSMCEPKGASRRGDFTTLKLVKHGQPLAAAGVLAAGLDETVALDPQSSSEALVRTHHPLPHSSGHDTLSFRVDDPKKFYTMREPNFECYENGLIKY